jgi:hypothetical protein
MTPRSFGRFLTAATCLAVCCLASAAAAGPPGLVRWWPTAETPMGLAIGLDGRIYLGPQAGSSALVHIYGQTGAALGALGGGDGSEVEAVGVLSNQNVIAVHSLDQFGFIFGPGGTLQGYEGSRRRYLAVGPRDTLFITDDVDGVVRRCRTLGNGAVIGKWPTPQPSGICYLGGLLYVAGMTNGLISAYKTSGAFVGAFPSGVVNGQQLNPDGAGHLVLADHGAHQLKCFSPDGTLLWSLGPTVPGYPFATCDFFSVVADANGTIFAGDFTNRAILVLSPQATPVRSSRWGQLKRLFR